MMILVEVLHKVDSLLQIFVNFLITLYSDDTDFSILVVVDADRRKKSLFSLCLSLSVIITCVSVFIHALLSLPVLYYPSKGKHIIYKFEKKQRYSITITKLFEETEIRTL